MYCLLRTKHFALVRRELLYAPYVSKIKTG